MGKSANRTETAGVEREVYKVEMIGHASAEKDAFDCATFPSWKEGDSIAVWDKFGCRSRCEIQAQGGAHVLDGDAAGADCCLAVFPFDQHLDCYQDNGAFYLVGRDLPSAQQAVHGRFSPALELLCADVAGPVLNFHRIPVLIKFRMAGGETAAIKTVTLTGDGMAPLSGSCMEFRVQSREVVVSPASDSIVLAAPADGFKEDVDYFFVVLPSANLCRHGMTFTFTRHDGATYIYKTEEKLMLHSGQVSDVGCILLKEFHGPGARLANVALVRAVEAAFPDIGWEKDADGAVCLTEENLSRIRRIVSLDISGKGLADLHGIEYFERLERLDCSQNCLSSVVLRGLERMVSLNCSDNALTSIDLSGMINLRRLDCSFNRLDRLELDGAPGLVYLNCAGNRLAFVDVGVVPALRYLDCSGNHLSGLTVGALSHLVKLVCFQNSFEELDLTENACLSELSCGFQCEMQGAYRELRLLLDCHFRDKWEEVWQVNQWNKYITVDYR